MELLGDYNGNGTIDAADYTVWRDALAAGSPSLLNDATPAAVDESDYTYWRAHFGESAGSGATAAAGSRLPPCPSRPAPFCCCWPQPSARLGRGGI